MSDFRNCLVNWSGNGLWLPLLPQGRPRKQQLLVRSHVSPSLHPSVRYHFFLLPSQSFCGVSAASWLRAVPDASVSLSLQPTTDAPAVLR